MLTLLLIWIGISIPASLIVGAFLALSSKSEPMLDDVSQAIDLPATTQPILYSEPVMAEAS